MGAKVLAPESSAFEKRPFQISFEKGPPGTQKRSKINTDGIFGVRGPIWLPPKKLVDFWDGCQVPFRRIVHTL